jgi:hypothetical protein
MGQLMTNTPLHADLDLPAEGPLARAKSLAEQMATILNDEDVAAVTLAIAYLSSGVIHQYADTLPLARDLMQSLRRVEDRMIENAYEDDALPVH